MPIYEYECDDCHKQFSALKSVLNAETETVCTECGSVKVRKLVSSFACCSPFGGGSHASGGGFSGGG